MKTKIYEALKKYFRYTSFRPKQEEIVTSIVSGQDVLAILPTGAGKSLCFQLPAVLMEGVTIVISPLISLMLDQVKNANSRGIPAVCINQSVDYQTTKKIYAALEAGRIKVLYVAPERFEVSKFTEILTKINVGSIIVDESHCHPKGTLINTKYGYKPIEILEPGNEIISVCHETGKVRLNKIKKVFKRIVSSDEIFEVSNGPDTVVLTKDHPVYVNNLGYFRADELPDNCCIIRDERVQRNYAKDLSYMWEPIRVKGSRKRSLSKLLFKRVLVDFDERRENLCGLLKEISNQQILSAEKMLSGLWIRIDSSVFFGSYEEKQSNEISRSATENAEKIKSIRRSLWEKSGWKRQGFNQTSKNNFRSISCPETRTSCVYWDKEQWPELECIYRFMFSRAEDCNRSGWTLPRNIKREKVGHGKRFSYGFTRLESIKNKEQGNRFESGRCDSKSTTVYSFELERDHNYFADGILVHNCIDWGFDFRPAYLQIGEFLKHYDVPRAAFTASATKATQANIIKFFGLRNPVTIQASFNRPNLTYEVRQKAYDGIPEIAQIIKAHAGQRGIVYRSSRKKCEETAEWLGYHGIKAVAYHAGMDNELRQKNQNLFTDREVDVVCATIAFGMGIDIPDIRYVIHGDLPKSMEGYYQETGRGGRDGKISECILLYSKNDKKTIEYFIDQADTKERKEILTQQMYYMRDFAEEDICRRKKILAYFGEEIGVSNCGSCDVCLPNYQFGRFENNFEKRQLFKGR